MPTTSPGMWALWTCAATYASDSSSALDAEAATATVMTLSAVVAARTPASTVRPRAKRLRGGMGDLLSLSVGPAGVDAYRFKNALGRVALAHESRCARRKRMLTALGSRTQGNDSQVRPEPTNEYHTVARVGRAPVPIQ